MGDCQQSARSVRWETHTWVGSGEGRQNEDYAHYDSASSCAVLVDGATGLTKANVVPGQSDAAWFAHALCCEVARQLCDKDALLDEALPTAGREVARQFRQIPGACNLQRIDEPNGSLAVLRWHEPSRTATVALLGDCTAAFVMRDGSIRVLHDDTLTLLDNANYERMYQHACARGCTMAQARKALNPRFIENRLKMNEPGGYWAADISCRGMTHARMCVAGLDEVAGLFACSDGYAQAVDMGVVPTPEELVARVVAGEGVTLGEALRAAERADAGCWRVHRSKTSDDATYAYVSFGA